MTKKQNLTLFGGLGLTLYGLASLLFEVASNNFSDFTKTVWWFLNPLFVYGCSTHTFYVMSELSFFGNFSTPEFGTLTLIYWVWPIGLIIIGFTLMFGSLKT
jgi:hypothetical protein